MALTAGTVTISDDGAPTKSGLAEAIYDEFVDNFTSDVEALTGKAGVCIPDDRSGVAIKRGYAIQATRIATAIVDYITTNAEVTVVIETTDAGLQRDPTTTTPTLGPGAQKTLGTSATIS